MRCCDVRDADESVFVGVGDAEEACKGALAGGREAGDAGVGRDEGFVVGDQFKGEGVAGGEVEERGWCDASADLVFEEGGIVFREQLEGSFVEGEAVFLDTEVVAGGWLESWTFIVSEEGILGLPDYDDAGEAKALNLLLEVWINVLSSL
ncbi:hypothetical protein BS50DRAFT_593852 [Corynespora cassiicola Philippines]|uniref:Uncharacterized protein n=1 Tax=Corynespora cassiicola Philippines TaxID=1448308 RepID=A0A2T2N4R9_CORCC|nr:hypothetical protein BS50DRAFT_593852 [Corynespora cassiicola Philippines]